jgi:hypothetical protein
MLLAQSEKCQGFGDGGPKAHGFGRRQSKKGGRYWIAAVFLPPVFVGMPLFVLFTAVGLPLVGVLTGGLEVLPEESGQLLHTCC